MLHKNHRTLFVESLKTATVFRWHMDSLKQTMQCRRESSKCCLNSFLIPPTETQQLMQAFLRFVFQFFCATPNRDAATLAGVLQIGLCATPNQDAATLAGVLQIGLLCHSQSQSQQFLQAFFRLDFFFCFKQLHSAQGKRMHFHVAA